MNRREIFHQVTSAAEPLYGRGEAEQIARIVIEELGGVSWSRYILEPNGECEVADIDVVIKDIERGRPIQYIIGRVEFCNLEFNIREGALIPRPESEELINWIVSESVKRQKLRIIDLCSGSGALAVALSCKLPQAEVSAVELSDDALSIANENIERLAPRVKLINGDVLKVKKFIDGEYDIIVSNPPYIPECEREQMHTNVVDHEPSMALFVPNDDPLLFYRSIAISALDLLSSGGRLYFEVHENYATSTAEMMEQLGYRVELRRDINDKDRMICGARE